MFFYLLMLKFSIYSIWEWWWECPVSERETQAKKTVSERERETKDKNLFSTIKLRQTCKDRKEALLVFFFFGYKQLLEGAQSSIKLN